MNIYIQEPVRQSEGFLYVLVATFSHMAIRTLSLPAVLAAAIVYANWENVHAIASHAIWF